MLDYMPRSYAKIFHKCSVLLRSVDCGGHSVWLKEFHHFPTFLGVRMAWGWGSIVILDESSPLKIELCHFRIGMNSHNKFVLICSDSSALGQVDTNHASIMSHQNKLVWILNRVNSSSLTLQHFYLYCLLCKIKITEFTSNRMETSLLWLLSRNVNGLTVINFNPIKQLWEIWT